MFQPQVKIQSARVTDVASARARFQMRFLLVAVLLMASMGTALADWVKVATVGPDTHYAKTPAIAGTGQWVKSWQLIDYADAQDRRGKKVRSGLSLAEFDCVSRSGRLLSLLFYSDQMGKGDVVQVAKVESKWEPTQPGVPDTYWKAACIKQ